MVNSPDGSHLTIMRCETIAIGTELLLGHNQDTNSTWMAQQLAGIGVDCHHQSKVDDDVTRIVEVIEQALKRSDAIIVCGGLGPTHDDLTREAICQIMQTTVVRDEKVVERISALFKARARVMSANNLRQADVPIGARVIDEQPGTAPGLVCPIGDKVVYAVPGVPSEMKAMMHGTILNDLKNRSGASSLIRSRTLRTWGTSESALAEMIQARIDATHNDAEAGEISFQASGIEGIKVRVTAKAQDEQQVSAILDKEETQLRAILGDLVFAVDDETMESTVLQLLRERGLSLAVAESLTGGMVGSRLTAVAGASDVFRGALVSYASELKFNLLGVDEGPVVSEACAIQMAKGVRQLLNADVGISTTGVAGPNIQDDQPVGSVFVALSLPDRVTATHLQLPGPRQRIREFSVIGVLNLLRLTLLEHYPSAALS